MLLTPIDGVSQPFKSSRCNARGKTILKGKATAHAILTFSPGPASNTVAVFRVAGQAFELSVTHPAEELAQFEHAAD